MNSSVSGDLLPGKWYELALFTYALIHNSKKKFDLGKEIKFGGKWDDLVVKVHENSCNLYNFIQIKLLNDSENKDNFIDSEVLLGKRKISLKEDDFKLQKYFISYLRIKDQLNSRNDSSKIHKLIIFTNAHLNINELQKKVGTVSSISHKSDVVPNTSKDLKLYAIHKPKHTFLEEIKKNNYNKDFKSDSEYLAEELASYAISTKTQPMTLETDYFSYYHTALLDEKVIEVKIQKQGKFTQNFIEGQGLSTRAHRLRARFLEIIIKKNRGKDISKILEDIKARNWRVSEDFCIRKTEDTIFLPDYDISYLRDILGFFSVLEFRTSQLGVKDLLNTIDNVEIQNKYLEYYDTDPKLIKFLIDDFIQGWKHEKVGSERWILNAERSKFIAELQSKISKPKVIYKTREYIKYLKYIIEKYNLYYHDEYYLYNDYLKNTFTLIKTVSNILTSVKILKYLEDIKRKDYIFIDMANLLHQKEIVKMIHTLHNDEFNLLIISCKIIEDNNVTNELFAKLSQVTTENKSKKIFFIADINEDFLINKLKEIGFKENVDKTLGLEYVEDASKIVDQKITIHDKTLKLSDFIENSEVSYKFINPKTIECLISNEEIKIHSKSVGKSYLEGAYTKLVEDVEVEVLVDELLSQKSNDIYIISCMFKMEQKEKLIRSLKAGIHDAQKKLRIDSIKSKIKLLNQFDITNLIDSRIQIADYNLTEIDFKQICQNKSERKIYWIKLKQEGNLIKFVLLQIYNPDFYLKGKRFNNEVVIEKNITKELASPYLTETFLIGGRYKQQVVKWLQLSDNKKQFQENCKCNKITILSPQDSGESYFQEMIQQNPHETFHLLNFKQDKLIWCKTHGSFENISKYRSSDYQNTSPLLDEDDILKEIQDSKVAIIAGDPGSGKSTALVTLYEQTYRISSVGESILTSHWLFEISLKDHTEKINNIDYENNTGNIINEIVNLLMRDNCKDFDRTLLGMALLKKNFKKPVLIVFDGFDEVLNESERNKIITLLQFLKYKTEAKIWITTRFHYEQILERALSTFAIKLEQMNPKKIREYIEKYFENSLRLILCHRQYQSMFCITVDGVENRIGIYIQSFLQRMQEIFKGNIFKFIGIPLQLYLMLEGSVRYFKKWIKNCDGVTPDFSYLGTDLWTVYENFVDRKYNIYFKKADIKENLKQKQDKSIFDSYHRGLAKSLMFKSGRKKTLEEIKDVILLPGIVRSLSKDIEFIHPTFREYYVANTVITWIDKWKIENICEVTNFEKQKFLLNDILLKPDHKIIRAFLNAKLLRANIKDVQIRNQFYDEKVVFVAARENNVGIATFILDNIQEAKVNPQTIYKSSVLTEAAGSGNLEMVQFLQSRGCNLNDVDESVLHYAVSSYNIKLVEYLITNGANVNGKDSLGRPVLQMDTTLEIVEVLVENGADVNAVNEGIGMSVLQSAADFCKFDIFKFLIRNGADVNAKDNNGVSVLHSAAGSKNLEIVTLLVKMGANVKAKTKYNMTVLHFATWFGDLETVEFLVKEGVDVEAVDDYGRTALHCAAEFGNLDIVKFLIEKHNLDVNSIDRDGKSVLHFAVENEDNLETVKFVAKYISDINVRDNKGRTALHNASLGGYVPIIEFLLTQNADLTLEDENKQTALDLAKLWRQAIGDATITILTQCQTKQKRDGNRTSKVLKTSLTENLL